MGGTLLDRENYLLGAEIRNVRTLLKIVWLKYENQWVFL